MDAMTEQSQLTAAPVSPWVENMAALWATDPDLARQIDALPNDAILPTEPAKDGARTLRVQDSAGKAVYLHSRYAPIDEARKLIDPLPLTERMSFPVLGMGLGYHVRELFSRGSDEIRVDLFEPNLQIVRTALEEVDLSKPIVEKRLKFIVTLDKGVLFTDWMQSLGPIAMGFDPVEHVPSLRVSPEFFAQAKQLIEEFKSFGKTSVNTLLLNGRRTCENLARNIPWYISSPGLGRLKNSQKDRPAIIVSAGPSLRKNKHLLPQTRGRATMIAVQTSLIQLVEMGIEPDFVTSLDYHDVSAQFFERIPKDCRTELVAEPKATPKVLGLHPGPKTILGNEYLDRILREIKLDRPKLQSGATVAHLAFYLAEYLGCNPIIFVGQDLGFSDGLYYAPGTSYDDRWRPELNRFNTWEMMHWQRIVREKHILRRVPDYKGGQTYTEQRFFTYLQQFERDFLKSDRTIIDATEGGAAKRGTTIMPLAQAIEQYCTQPLVTTPPAHEGADYSRIREARECVERRLSEANQIHQLTSETLPLLEQIQISISDQTSVNRLIAQIDPLRKQMNALGATYDLITQLTQQSEMARFAADQRILLAKADGVERQKRQLDRDIENVRHVRDAAKNFIELMQQCIELCDQTMRERGIA